MMLEDLYRLLRSSHVQAQGIVDTLTDPLLVLDQSYRVITANNAFLQTFKVDRDDTLDRSLYSLGNGQWDIQDLRLLLDAVIPKTAAVIGYEVTHDFPAIGKRTFLVDARRLVHPDNNSLNILVLFNDVTERKRHEAERDFVIDETRHRLKNVFSIIRAIAAQTETAGRTAEQYRDVLLGRIDAAMRAQEISINVNRTVFSTLLEKATAEIGGGRIRIEDGPATKLRRSQVLPVSLAFHELTTNALKYGSLSVPDGLVTISWRLEATADGTETLVCTWREQGGPPCHPPKKRGYGTTLIEGTVNHLGGSAQLNFESDGLTAVLTLPR